MTKLSEVGTGLRARVSSRALCRWSLFALGAVAILFLVGCGGDDTPQPTATADVASDQPSPTEVPSATSSATDDEGDEGWFVRTIASLGDERGLCIDLPGWTPTNINFDAPVHSHTCKHGWWNHDGRFDRPALGEGRLEMPFFERCLEAASLEPGSSFFTKPCDGGQRQQFTHLETGQIVLVGSQELCLSVADGPLRDAGGDDFWMNGLILDTCGEEDEDRQRWVFTEPL